MSSPDERGEATFTAEDALAVARHLQEFPSVILVGGQSLNFWAEQFRADVPDLERLAPFQSSDVDFLGSVSDVEVCARRLGGNAAYPSPDQINTPEVGIVICTINGKSLKINFLANLAGLTSAKVRQAAIQTQIGEVVLRVLHPVNVVKSRLANIVQLRRHDPLSLRQMRVSIYVVSEYIRRAIAERPRIGLDLIENVFDLALSREGIKLWYEFDIDIFKAIRPFERLPEEFSSTRLPQMKAFLLLKRERQKSIQAVIAQKKRGKIE